MRLSEGKGPGQNRGKGKFRSLVAGKGKGQNRDGRAGKFTTLLCEPTPRAAQSPPSAPPVNTFRSSLDVDVERFTNGQSLGVLGRTRHPLALTQVRGSAAQVLPTFLLPFGKARDRERKKLVAELELKHLNTLKTFDEVRDSFGAVTPAC